MGSERARSRPTRCASPPAARGVTVLRPQLLPPPAAERTLGCAADGPARCVHSAMMNACGGHCLVACQQRLPAQAMCSNQVCTQGLVDPKYRQVVAATASTDAVTMVLLVVQGLVIVCDINPSMLQEGQKRAAAQGLGKCHLALVPCLCKPAAARMKEHWAPATGEDAAGWAALVAPPHHLQRAPVPLAICAARLLSRLLCHLSLTSSLRQSTRLPARLLTHLPARHCQPTCPPNRPPELQTNGHFNGWRATRNGCLLRTTA